MRKLCCLLLVAGLFLAAQTSFAKDSTWLANESVMTSRVSRADVNVPVGTIISWTSPQDISDSDKWLVCDGRPVPRNSELFLDYGMTVTPNLSGNFMRGTNLVSEIGKHYEDSLRSHNHEQPGHTHYVDAQLTSTAVAARVDNTKVTSKVTDTATEGKAEGQMYNWGHTGIGTASQMNAELGSTTGQIWYTVGLPMLTDVTVKVTHNVNGSGVSFNGVPNARVTAKRDQYAWEVERKSQAQESKTTGKLINDAVSGQLDNSSVSGNVRNGHSSGEAHMAGDDPTYFTSMYGATRTSTTIQDSNTETAPKHMRVLYLIRCNR